MTGFSVCFLVLSGFLPSFSDASWVIFSCFFPDVLSFYLFLFSLVVFFLWCFNCVSIMMLIVVIMIDLVLLLWSLLVCCCSLFVPLLHLVFCFGFCSFPFSLVVLFFAFLSLVSWQLYRPSVVFVNDCLLCS